MLIFNGQILPSYVRVIHVNRPLFAPSEVISSSIIGRAGTFLFSQRLGAYTITVHLRIEAENKMMFRQRVRELALFLYTEKEAPLIINDEPDKYIQAIVFGEIDVDESSVFGDVEVQFYCPDPYWYAIHDDISTLVTAGTHTIRRSGTANSHPLILVRGQGTNGKIAIGNGDHMIEYAGDLKDGEILVFDSELMTAFIEYEESCFPVLNRLTNLDFIVLSPGQNLMTVTTENITLQDITIQARSRWI